MTTFWFSCVVRVVHVVGVGDAEVGIEAVVDGEGFGVVAEVPFAKAGGGVALGFEVVCNGVLFRIEAFFRMREKLSLIHI